mgnify:CR=1 FL=1
MICMNAERRWGGVSRQRTVSHRWVWTLLSIFILLVPVIARAQIVEPICVPPSLGVPPAYQPPHWWDNSPTQPVYYQKLTDPRWQGAAAVSRTNGLQETNSFLALQDGTYLYLSWRHRDIPLGSVGQNVLFVGYERASDSKPIIVQATLATTSITEAGGSGAVDPDAIELDATGVLKTDLIPPGVNMPDPAWVDDNTRAWINNPVQNSYAVQMRIPISDLKFTGGTFKLWFEMLAGSPAIPVSRFVWPRTGADIGEQAVPPFAKTFPLPTAWKTFKLSTGPSDMSCPAQSISLGQDKIATKNPNPNEILYKKSPDTKPENVLFARPTNNSGGNIPADKLKATFRIANWGSQPNFEDWEVGVPIDTLWAKVPCAGADPTSGAVGNLGAIANGVTATDANELRCRWTLSDGEITPFESGARNSHSCVLVEMTDTMTPGLVYRNRSMWNNFDVRPASVLEKPAQITLKGLAHISPSGRDVYVYVETRNMPDKVPQENDNKMPDKVPQAIERKVAYNEPREGPLALKRAITEGKVTSADLSRMIAGGQVSEIMLDEILPTYIVHVYHDTGKSLTLGGVKRPILNEQGAFGYRITHVGDLLGWTHALNFAAGHTVDKLAPNFYRIRNVPNNGTVNVITRIESLIEGHCRCLDFKCLMDSGKQASLGSGIAVGGVVLFGMLSIGGYAFFPRRTRRDEAPGENEESKP